MKTAVYTGTRNLYGDMMTACKSLLYNSDVDKIYLLVEDDIFPYDLPECIEAVNIVPRAGEIFPADGANMETKFTIMALMRAALFKVFPEQDRILSLDVDTIVDKRIDEIWDLPIDDCYFAGCRETHRSKNGLMYCNAGVILQNLKMLRNGKGEEIIYLLNHWKYPWVDQDAFNYLCQGRIYDMSSDYNDTDWTVRPNKCKIKHYAGIKYDKWTREPLVQKYRDMSLNKILEARDVAKNERQVNKS